MSGNLLFRKEFTCWLIYNLWGFFLSLFFFVRKLFFFHSEWKKKTLLWSSNTSRIFQTNHNEGDYVKTTIISKVFFILVISSCLFLNPEFDRRKGRKKKEKNNKKTSLLLETIISVIRLVSFNGEAVTHKNHFHFHQKDLSGHKCLCSFLPAQIPSSFQTGEEL